MGGYLITSVRVFDGSGRHSFAGSVRVEGHRIRSSWASRRPRRWWPPRAWAAS
jgi:hypothetical protein